MSKLFGLNIHQPIPMGTQNGSSHRRIRDLMVIGSSSQGGGVRANLLKLGHQSAVFEIYNPELVLRTSEVFENLKIVSQDRTIYSGGAVVRNLVDAGTMLVCEVSLNDALDVAKSESRFVRPGDVREEFDAFIESWQKSYLVTKDYKSVVTDLQTFLIELRLWLEPLEKQIGSQPAPDRQRMELDLAFNLRDQVVSSIGSIFERFEAVSQDLDGDSCPAHRAFGKRLLNPLLLSSPFMNRTYAKPLGYAGDYEMMNMIVRNGMEGGSLFAKLVNAYLLDQPPCRAVRNRVDFLNIKIIEETSRLVRSGRKAKVFCVACGPAWEAVNFVAQHPLADQAEFSLLDFNEETLRYTEAKLEDVKRLNHRSTSVRMIRNSVQNLLRGNDKTTAPQERFDLIYCSGLYDYLSDRVCKALNSQLYKMLRPGGLMVVGNFAASTRGQNLMEHLMEWFLIYRDSYQLSQLAPEQAGKGDCVVRAEPTGSNIFLEVRKPQ